jgi:hypothetical protein
LSVIKNAVVRNSDAFLGDVPLENHVSDSSCRIEQRAVIRFFPLKKLSAKDMRAGLEGVYGHEALSLSAGKKWHERSATGRISGEDDLASGRPPQSDLCESMRALIEEIPSITCQRISQKPPIAITPWLRVRRDHLGFGIQ